MEAAPFVRYTTHEFNAATTTMTERRGLDRVRGAVAAFFYEADSAINLAVARIAVCVAVLKAAETGYLVNPTLLPAELIRYPIGMGWLGPLVPTTTEHQLALLWVVRCAAVAGALGACTRLATGVVALGTLFLFVVPNSYGHVAHVHHHLVWFTAIIAASRAGDALSLDAWWRSHPGKTRRAPCYGFPLRAMAVVLGVSYFCTGFWKVAVGGLEWIFSDNLRYLASKQGFIADGVDPSFGAALIGPVAPISWTEMLTARHVVEPPWWLARLGGFFTIVFEMGFVFAILTRTGRLVAAGAGIAFHNFTRIFAGIGFDELLLCYPFLVDVDGWVRWLRGQPRDAPPDTAPTRAASQPSPLLVGVAAALILGTATFGALRIGGAWPVSCAPRFDVVHSPLFSSYVVSGVLPDGTAVHVRDGGLGGALFGRRLREIIRGRQYHVPGFEQPDGRLPRWQILCTFVWRHHPALAAATDVRFSFVDVDLSDGAEHAKVIGERELFHCTRADESAD